MLSWQIILAGAATATFTVAIAFLSEATQSAATLGIVLVSHWPAIVILWTSAYAGIALLLSTVAMLWELASVGARSAWPRSYFVRLEITQYFTAVLVLLGLGLWPVAAETEPFSFLPAIAAKFPALAACGVVLLAGMVGWLAVATVAALRVPSRAEISPRPDLQLLHEILELLNARSFGPAGRVEIAGLSDSIQRNQRAMLEGLHDLTTAIDRLRNGVADIKLALQSSKSQSPSSNNAVAPSEIDHCANDLRAATAALVASVAKLDEIAARLPGGEVMAGAQANVLLGSPAQELQQLLHEMTASAAQREPRR